ncbi:MAG: hypothetical protein JWP91_562 [Fibrobacteres bacterium]|nr:hypothetical protein [Fibrobacterota bacterium]
MDAHMDHIETASATGAYPAFASFAVQEYAQTGMIHLVSVLRDPGTGELCTREFIETQQHGGEFTAYKTVPWSEKVPEAAVPVGASAGNLNDFHKIFWTAWQADSKWHALALTQEDPITVPILPGDVAIHAPVQYQDRKLRLFFWRKSGNAYALCNHVFSGEQGEKGTVATEKLVDIPYEPRLSRADPIAMKWIPKKGFEDAGLAVIGWLSDAGTGLRAHAALLDGKSVRVLDSDPIAGYKAFPDQRIGIWRDPSGTLRMAWLMGRTDADSVRAAEWTVPADPGNGIPNLRIRGNAFAAKNLRSAACVIPRNPEDKDAMCFLATRTGNLYLDDNGGRLRKLRADLPPAYDFPIFASAVGTWEARFDPKGSIFFTSPF